MSHISCNNETWLSLTFYLKEIIKIYKSCDQLLEFWWNQHFFTRNQEILLYQEIQIQTAYWYIISNSFNLFWVFKVVLINMVSILIMSAKMATLGLLNIRLFWNKDYDVIIYVHDVINQILSRDSNYIVEVVLWPKFCNCSIYMRQIIITSIL